MSKTPKQEMPYMISIDEAAERLGVNNFTVRRAISRGEIPAYRIGSARVIRIKVSDLNKALRPVTNLSVDDGGDAA